MDAIQDNTHHHHHHHNANNNNPNNNINDNNIHTYHNPSLITSIPQNGILKLMNAINKDDINSLQSDPHHESSRRSSSSSYNSIDFESDHTMDDSIHFNKNTNSNSNYICTNQDKYHNSCLGILDEINSLPQTPITSFIGELRQRRHSDEVYDRSTHLKTKCIVPVSVRMNNTGQRMTLE